MDFPLEVQIFCYFNMLMQQVSVYLHIQIPHIILCTVFFKHSQRFEGSKDRTDGVMSQFKPSNILPAIFYFYPH